MKRHIILLLILSGPLFLFSQHIAYEPLEFLNYTPKWQSVLYDSTEVDVEFYDGYNHIKYSAAAFHNHLIYDDNLIIPYYIGKDYYAEGFQLFSINLSNGEQNWSRKIDLKNNDRQEFLFAHNINPDNEYEVYSARRIEEPGNDFFPSFFAYYGDSSVLATRKYDIMNGDLISTWIPNNEINPNTVIQHSLSRESFLFVNDTVLNYIQSSIPGDQITNFELDKSGGLIDEQKSIEIAFKNDYGDIQEIANRGSGNIYQLNNDSIFILRTAYTEDYSLKEASIRLYDEVFSEESCIDLLSRNPELPIFKSMGISDITEEHIILNVTTFDQDGFDAKEIWIFDYSGELVLQAPQLIDGSVYVSKSIIYDEDLDAFVMFGFNQNTRNVDIFSSQNGYLINKFTLEIVNKDIFPIFHNINKVGEDSYLLELRLRNVTDIDKNQSWETLMLFDNVYNSFNLITSSDDIVGHPLEINVFPNPSSGMFTVEGCDNCNYQIFYINGRLYRQGVFEGNSITIDDNGTYVLKIIGKEQTISKLLVLR